MYEKKQILRIALTYAGTVMGAGFASGQELLQFFASYGLNGFYGIIFACLLLSWLGSKVMNEGYRLQAKGYHEVLYSLCGKRLGLLLDICTFLFLLGIYAVMLAGMATLIRTFDLVSYEGSLLLAAFLTSICSLRGIRGITSANFVLTPLLAFFALATCIYSLTFHFPGWQNFYFPLCNPPILPNCQASDNWIFASLQYTSYNLLLALTVLGSLGALTPQHKIRKAGSILGAFLLGCLAVLVTAVVIMHYPASTLQDFPLLYIAGLQHDYNQGIFSLMLFGAMFTTALATQFGCSAKLSSLSPASYLISVCIIGFLGTWASSYGFVGLISVLYPLFGTTGFLFIICLMVKILRGNQ